MSEQYKLTIREAPQLSYIDSDPAKAAASGFQAGMKAARELASQAPAIDKPGPSDHSTDYRSVRWAGVSYDFTGNQAACVKILWENWQRGTPDIGGQTILEVAESNSSRIDAVFRKHEAWGTMIVPGATKGTYRLAGPIAKNPAMYVK